MALYMTLMNLATMNSAPGTEFTLSGLTKHVPLLARLTDGTGLMPNSGKPPSGVRTTASPLAHIFSLSFEFLMNKASKPHGEATYQQECIEYCYVSKTKTTLEKTIVIAFEELIV